MGKKARKSAQKIEVARVSETEGERGYDKQGKHKQGESMSEGKSGSKKKTRAKAKA